MSSDEIQKRLTHATDWFLKIVIGVTGTLILILFNDIRSDVRELRDEAGDIKQDTYHIEAKLTGIERDVNSNNRRLDRIEKQLDDK